MMETNTERGRAELAAWESSKPRNFYDADTNLQHIVARYLGEGYAAAEPSLRAFGEQCATMIDRLAKQEDVIGNHPRLDRFDGIGRRTERILFHPNHDAIGRLVWASGMLALQREPGNTVQQLALMMLLSHNGEGGVMCAVACTSGLIRALQQAADATVRDRFLPALLETDYERAQQGAQFLTEVQGGSDVGANAVIARDAGAGEWRISGEKWFCSNINADQFLVMARVIDADGNVNPGTGGLGAFVIPRTLANGETNSFYIRRLKDKLGTRTLASAEVDFNECAAYAIGAPENGFKITVSHVLNTSRLINAAACAGIMRRAYIEAHTYACSRQAFGNVIASYPLVQEAIADILSEAQAAAASCLFLGHVLDRLETGTANADDEPLYRLLVNVNKYITSVRATECVHRAIEVLGGNGAIESFSILPRLYRDMMVLESWEGTHNVLCLQIIRDIVRYRLHEPFERWMESALDAVETAALTETGGHIRQAYRRCQAMVTRLMAADAHEQATHARRLVDIMAALAQASLLLTEAAWDVKGGRKTSKIDVLTYYVQRRLVVGYDPMNDAAYGARLARIIV
jgi:hypothetical protein